jgi:hypothetical protein
MLVFGTPVVDYVFLKYPAATSWVPAGYHEKNKTQEIKW